MTTYLLINFQIYIYRLDIPAEFQIWIALYVLNISLWGTSLVVQWFGLCASVARGKGLTPGQGTKIPQAKWQKKKKERINIVSPLDLRDISSSVYLIIHNAIHSLP